MTAAKLSPEELAIRRRLKDNFPHYAAKCLKIRPKKGGLIPLDLNRVQRHIHERLQRQIKQTGKVRAGTKLHLRCYQCIGQYVPTGRMTGDGSLKSLAFLS